MSRCKRTNARWAWAGNTRLPPRSTRHREVVCQLCVSKRHHSRGAKTLSAGNAGPSIPPFTEGSQAGFVRYRLGSRQKETTMKSIPLALASILALAGCAQFDKQFGQQAALSTGIAPGEVEWARKTGRNTVSGNATLKSGGTTHTCAGQSANLIPDTAYARARMTAIFGNSSRGTRAANLGPVKFERDDPLYVW